MLKRLEYPEPLTGRVYRLVAHHHTYSGVTELDHRILLEADFLVNSFEEQLSHAQITAAREAFFRNAKR